LRTKKFSFEASDLSKYLIKNLQSIIDNQDEADDPSESMTQQQSSSSFLQILGKKDKGKGKNYSQNNP